MKDLVNVSEAFEQYLKELSLNEFPSGKGTWRNNLKWKSDLLESNELIENPQLYTVESLEELADKVPFQKETKWSADAKSLQKKFTEDPADDNVKNIYKCFKQLRIVDRNVKIVDDGIKKFVNLQELTLSANKIETLSASILPRKIKVLELCGNQISDIGSICFNPPPLQHLGISYNRILSVSEFIKPDCWNSLLSLDLSFNFMNDISSTVSSLTLLPKLRSLLLQGNPLYFFIGYRGYVIDSIKSLSLLDDIRISADERHHFKGLCKVKELPLHQCIVALKFGLLKGLNKPDELEVVAEEYPKTVTKFHVEMDFIGDCKIQEEDFLTAEQQTEDDTLQKDDVTNTVITTNVSEDSDHSQVEDKEKVQILRTNEFIPMEDEGIALNYSKIILSTNTDGLQKYLQNKVQVKLMENKIVMSDEPKPNIDNDESMTEYSGIPKEKSGKSVDKMKSKVSVVKKDIKEDKGKTKPKQNKQDNVELFEWSRTQNLIGTCDIDFQSLLEGASVFDKECMFQTLSTYNDTRTPSTVPDDVMGKKNDPKKKGGKDLRKGSSRPISSVKSARNKNMESDIRSAPNDQLHSVPSQIQENDTDISVEFSMEILRWNTAKEGLVWTQKFNNNDV